MRVSNPDVTIIVPTHNRPDQLPITLAALMSQSVPQETYEIIVVDDGSTPPVVLPQCAGGPRCTLIRLEGVERSAARNAGAAAARGNLLIFLDDDIEVVPGLIKAYLSASAEWPEALLVGRIRLPSEVLVLPFCRFRQRLEDHGIPRERGPVSARNFCTAANMAMPRRRFEALGGFNPQLISGEDQDLAMRHTASGGCIAFVPEASAVHHDRALDVADYSHRVDWGSENMVLFCRHHPDWPENRVRDRVNGFFDAGRESWLSGLRKLAKSALASAPISALILGTARVLEGLAPNSFFLDRLYRLVVGGAIFRGYRRGLHRFGPPKRGLA